MWPPDANAALDYDSSDSKADPFENGSAVFGVKLSSEAKGLDPVVMQPVKASSNHKTETRQPRELRKSSPHTKTQPDSHSQHSFDTAGLPDIESSMSGRRSVPQCKTRATKGVSTAQLPLSPATSHSPPRVQPRSGKAMENIITNSKTINLSGNNGSPADATEVIHARRMKRKRVVESDDESEPTTKKLKSETAAVERTTSPRPKGSTYKTRRAAKANPRHKTLPTLIDDADALEAEQMKQSATAKEPEVRSVISNIVEGKGKRQNKAYSSPQGSNDQSSTSECERIFEWDCGALPDVTFQ
jgi:hypothetical protein